MSTPATFYPSHLLSYAVQVKTCNLDKEAGKKNEEVPIRQNMET